MSTLLQDYRSFTRSTAIYPHRQTMMNDLTENTSYDYVMYGLMSEIGEVAGKVKKYIRDGTSWNDLRDDVAKEVGDIMWYVDRLADEFALSLEDIIEGNVAKLQDRKDRGVLQGSGDNR